MESLLGAGVLVMLVADVVVGLRLLWLAAHTRQLAELCMGLATFLLGGVGYPLSIVARRGIGLAGLESETLLGVAFCVQNLACFAMWVFTWRVFRPDSRLAAGLVALAMAGFGSSLIFGFGHDSGAAYWLGTATRGLAFVWACTEATRYAALLRRRRALGLVDPVVLDRIRLWALSMGAVALAFAVFCAGRLSGAGTQAPWVLGLTSFAGVLCGVSLWLAFLPPAAYVRRVEARSA
ncbi:MAG: hypothetical protein QNK05_09755 [Myxococcota bacterium]|nr:hypothetical protein [Myxococcota bacterium]